MQEVAVIPDVDTIGGLIKDFVGHVAGQSPDSIEGARLDAFRIDNRIIIEGVRRCFGVQVPLSEFRTDLRTVGELCQVLGRFVHGSLEGRSAVSERPSAHRRLLIVGGAVPELEQAVARRGWRGAIITHYHVAHGAGNHAGVTGVIDEVEATDWGRPTDVVQRIVDLYSTGHIERVVPSGEFGLLPAALATTQLGIPGLSVRGVRNTRDKLHMRRALEQAGLGQLRYAACRGLSDAQAFLDRVGGPIILKPVSGTASDGVIRVATGDELASAFKVAMEADGFMGLICEEYIEGPEVSLEGYSVDGRFVPVALTDKLTDERFLEIGHQQPSSHPQSVFEAASDIAGRALAALGVTDGVTHTEFRISTRGPVLIETHTRMGGDYLNVLTQLTTGVDLADLMVAFSLGEAVDARPVPQGRAAAIRFLVGRPGRICGLKVPAMEPGNGIHSFLAPPLGRVVSGRSSSPDRLGHVIATGPTPEAAGRTAESFIAQIHVDYFNQ